MKPAQQPFHTDTDGSSVPALEGARRSASHQGRLRPAPAVGQAKTGGKSRGEGH